MTISAPLPKNEMRRLERLRDYQILDTHAEESFERIVRLAAAVLDVPMAVVSLVDEGRQWFKARIGIDAPETSRDVSFCAHAILGDKVYVVPDATTNPLFKDNPFVTGGPEVRFYAGAPLRTIDGFNLGTVCAIDRKPRTPTPAQLQLLTDLSAMVMEHMELRVAGRTAMEEVAERRQIDTFKTNFISTVNHELRTPLTSIVGVIDLINSGAAGDVPKEIADLVNIADRNASVLLRLINDLLDSAKIAEGRMAMTANVIDLDVLVTEAAENIENYCRDHGVKVVIGSLNKAKVRADKVRISQVMNNLLSNAVKFSPPHAAVRIDLVTRDGRAEVAVTDTAGGIPDSIRPRIFQKFVQANHGGGTPRPGTGLGLNIVKAIIDQHEGSIDFTTQTGVGSRFFFQLPLA